MREIDKIAEGLFEKIRDRFEDVSLGDDNAKATQDPERARFFNFDYVIDGENCGNITLSLIDEISLKVYFSKNISSDLDEEQRKQWYAFLRELREYARRNLLSFEPRDITRSTLKHRDIQQQSKADSTYDKDEVVAESLYGTRKSSYEKKGPVKIIVRHSEAVDETKRGARSRKINAILLQNQDGERFKLPHNNLRYARAMARHMSEGGSVMDDFGQHITEIAEEISKLRPFKYGMKYRTFEDQETQAMAEAAFEYHGLLNHTLKRLTGKKGYNKVKESFKAEDILKDDVDTQALKEKFVKKIFDDRLESALPIVQKAYEMKKNNKFTEYFESWADTVAEGAWALPDNDDEVSKLIDILSDPLPVGVDAQNATNALYNILGDDRLFDRLQELAETDPEADARDVVVDWLQDNLPQIYQKIENEIGDPDTPAEPAEYDQDAVDESVASDFADEDQSTLDAGSEYGDAIPGSTKNMMALPEDEEDCKYCGGDCPNDEEHACDGYLGDIDDLYKDQVKEDEEDDGGFEAIQSAIIRRIAHSHHELLMKLGPDGVLEAAREIAEFAAPVEEIGSSDVSGWVRQIERDAGIEQAHSDLHEAFERALNEAAINVGDTIRDKTQPEISGKVTGERDENYLIQVDGDEYHIKKLNAEKVAKEAIEMPANPDYSQYDKPTFQRNNPKELPKKSGWTGVNTAEPAYKRKAQYDQEKAQLQKLAGLQK